MSVSYSNGNKLEAGRVVDLELRRVILSSWCRSHKYIEVSFQNRNELGSSRKNVLERNLPMVKF